VLCPDSLSNDTEPTDEQRQLRSRLRYARPIAHQSLCSESARITPIEHWLAQHFEVPANFMVSAFRRFAGGPQNPAADNSLTVVPAHLHAGLDHLVLQPPEAIDTCAAEALALIDAANEFLAADQIKLQMIDPQCWLLTTQRKFDVTLSSSAMAIGRNVDIYMPAGTDGRALRSLLNELQMLWHDHPVNLAREDAGIPKINTVWPDGYAGLFESPANFDQLVSDNVASRGLAIATQIAAVPVTQVDSESLVTTNSVLELTAGASPVLQFLDSHPSVPLNLVLSDAQQWVQIRTSPKDRFCRWRPDPLHPSRR